MKKTTKKRTKPAVKAKPKAKKDEGLEFVKQVAAAAAKIKAIDIKIMDLRSLDTFADFFVVASGSSDRQVEAIAESIVVEMKKIGRKPIGVEGSQHAQWALVDFGDVIAHIFYSPMREFYGLEKLWADAKMIKYRESRPKTKPKAKRKS